MTILLDDISSTRVMRCIRCNEPITPENYSGWEAFLPDGKATQVICKFCDAEDNDNLPVKVDTKIIAGPIQ
jgi:hypothetical protein